MTSKQLQTEGSNPVSQGIDTLETIDILRVMNREDRVAVDAVGAILPQVAMAVGAIEASLRAGGRLIYVGAGTSGRLGVLDAAECPPTFSTSPDQIVAVIAGGAPALISAVEDAEDDGPAGAKVMQDLEVCRRDVVVGISVSGGAPYVAGALRHARLVGARTIVVACVDDPAIGEDGDVIIVPRTGPEVIAGSTRLKGGTATKLVLNMLSTASMIRVGKVYDNLMVDLRATNRKLRDRARRLVVRLAHVDDERAEKVLVTVGWRVKTAVVMLRGGLSAKQAEELVDGCGGVLRRALERVDGGEGCGDS